MLAGATQRSDSNPYDDSSPLIKIGPHWMIMWPFDPTTTGLPNSHRSTGAYILYNVVRDTLCASARDGKSVWALIATTVTEGDTAAVASPWRRDAKRLNLGSDHVHG
jgi:hypothetical protein